jgi:hemerythrin-like domain-containing protein
MNSRRGFLGGLGSGLVIAGCARTVSPAHARDEEGEGEGEVTPAEDLMREHGLLERVLLIYEEGVRRLDARDDTARAPIAKAAAIVRRFVEDYHERLEEQHLFPRFEARRVEAELVATLRAQHVAGRTLTAAITGGGDPAPPIRAFVRMYRPHHAREDTVLFAALPRVFAAGELHELGERFEDEEHRRFGAGGFEAMVAEVAAIEASLGIADLAAFTPRAATDAGPARSP